MQLVMKYPAMCVAAWGVCHSSALYGSGYAAVCGSDREGCAKASAGLTCLMCLETIIEAIVMLQCKAAGGEVSGHVRGGLGVHYSSALYGSDSAAVCGA